MFGRGKKPEWRQWAKPTPGWASLPSGADFLPVQGPVLPPRHSAFPEGLRHKSTDDWEQVGGATEALMRGNICLPSRLHPLTSASNLSGSRFPPRLLPRLLSRPSLLSSPLQPLPSASLSLPQSDLPPRSGLLPNTVAISCARAKQSDLLQIQRNGFQLQAFCLAPYLPSFLSSLTEFYSNMTERSRCVIDHHSSRATGQKGDGRRWCSLEKCQTQASGSRWRPTRCPIQNKNNTQTTVKRNRCYAEK